MDDPRRDYADAVMVALDLWSALAADDDAAVASLIMPELLEAFGPVEGIGGRIRGHREIKREDCADLGTVFPVAILAGEGIRAFFTQNRPWRPQVQAEEPLLGWSVEVYHRGDRWLANPTPRKMAEVVAYFHADGRIESPPAEAQTDGPGPVH
jgi:hypothetical protein